jgi:hypothetical protein
LRGIDRYCERYYSKGSRRRPVRIEFCEADILELFDDWRRAVGVTAGAGARAPVPRKPSLASHIERAIERLLAVRTSAGRSSPFALGLEAVVRELDGLLGPARHARGGERSTIVDRLAALDRELISAASVDLDAGTRERLRREADAELAPFVGRMSPEAKASALAAAFDRLLRETLKLPIIGYQ